MIVSLPTPDGPEMITSRAPGAPTRSRWFTSPEPAVTRASGDEIELEQRPAGQAFADAVARHRRPPVGDHGHPRPVLRVAPDGRFDSAHRRADAARGQGDVGLLDAPALELCHQRLLGSV